MDFLTIAQAAALIAKRALSPVELAQQCLGRIETLDAHIHSFITVTSERALDDARAAEHRMMTSSLKGRLDGVPIAHKDIFSTRAIATTAHSRLLEHRVPDEDAHVVSKLAEAGTSMLGKLATHEFALGGPSFDLPWPPARNPWNTEHFTSGSSSGAAAAVAAGLVLGATASDTGGSIREPASLCGVVGIKPTYGLCSRTGAVPLAFSLDHAGAIAWTVEDCALLLQAMAGYDARDPASRDRPVPDYTAALGSSIRGLRIGVVPAWHETDCPVSPAVEKGFLQALEIWRAQGAEIVEITMPSLYDYMAATLVIMLSEAYALHDPWMRSRFYDYGALFRDRILLGGLMGSGDYVQAQRLRQRLCIAMAKSVSDIDVIATPGAPREAARIDAVTKWGFLSVPGFAKPFNVTGWPALSLCSGFGDGGLPVSVQIAAKPFQEQLLFKVADAFERATDFRGSRPTISHIS
ncbi:aspartyl-tRNA(Asn)/glutamyl-tRNA(Gln) amidotransferase subunit A [Neorhizobium huautlense]|uniref:Aspartyl-tRNA(Asn)/glutamyl-tRNA(Gln) amidotransferase subunit A n=2 Tax=Neorhizobium huautlense TaxID=67774 RepID=A0ABT9PZ54_9HYPH|nr:aspartyl-tRNA(Asn)/glutamyl-tRNA(Gln) amidotransferase subunit A [Neorhizobium huautlense]